MDWKELLEPALPGVLEFLELALPGDAGKTRCGPEKMTAAVNLSQHALAIAGFRLPSHDQVGNLVQRTVDKMKSEGKLGGSKQGDQPGVARPHIIGEVMRPT